MGDELAMAGGQARLGGALDQGRTKSLARLFDLVAVQNALLQTGILANAGRNDTAISSCLPGLFMIWTLAPAPKACL
jgi:hypothetical protein